MLPLVDLWKSVKVHRPPELLDVLSWGRAFDAQFDSVYKRVLRKIRESICAVSIFVGTKKKELNPYPKPGFRNPALHTPHLMEPWFDWVAVKELN